MIVLRSVEAVSAAGTTRVNNVVGLGTTGFDVTDADASNVNGLAFNADGTKMYVVGLGSTTITQYGLSTAFNVRSATIEKTKVSILMVYSQKRLDSTPLVPRCMSWIES